MSQEIRTCNKYRFWCRVSEKGFSQREWGVSTTATVQVSTPATVPHHAVNDFSSTSKAFWAVKLAIKIVYICAFHIAGIVFKLRGKKKEYTPKVLCQRPAPFCLATCCSQPANWGFSDTSFPLPSRLPISSVCFSLLGFAAKPAASAAGSASDAEAAATEAAPAVAEMVGGADVAEVGLVALRFLRPNAPACGCVCVWRACKRGGERWNSTR